MKSLYRAFIAILLFAQIAVSAVLAQPLQQDQAFRLNTTADGDRLVLTWNIAEGYYLYRDHFGIRDSEAGTDLPYEAPIGEMKSDPNFGDVEIYYDSVSLSLPRATGHTIEVTYQGCQDGGICYRPQIKLIDPVDLTIASVDPAAATAVGGQWTNGTEAPVGSGANFAIAPTSSQVDGLMARGGIALVLGGFYLFGLLLAFTPCVFPMYPIVASLLAREGDGLTAGRGLALASAYVGGLAIAFAAIGAIAGWSGENLQLWLQSTWVAGIIATIFVVLALSMFGLFELQLPQSWTSRIASHPVAGRGTLGGATATGFTSALIVGPCVTAPLAGALLYIARSGDWQVGAAALAALAVGKGTPLVVMASFGGNLLPRAGAWMNAVKSVFGFVFLGTAIWMMTPLVPEGVGQIIWALLLAAFAVWAMRVTAERSIYILSRSTAVGAAFGSALFLASAALGSPGPLALARAVITGQAPATEHLEFASVTSAAELTEALSGNMPTLVYVTADWCTTCRTIDRRILSQTEVQKALSGLQLIKIDVSDIDAAKSDLMARLDVVGPPSMLFFDRTAREVTDTRLVGDVSAERLSLGAERAVSARP